MRLRDLAARKPGSPQSALLYARSLYWLAYTRYICGSDSLMRLYADSAASLLASPALAGATDLPYDRARVAELRALALPHDTARARIYADCLRAYRQAGDSFHTGIICSRMAAMMSSMSDLRDGNLWFRKARDYAGRAPRQRFIADFNLLINLTDMKQAHIASRTDSLRADSLARLLAASPLFPSRPSYVRLQVFKAMADASGSRAWLDSARSVASGSWQAVADAWFARHWLTAGRSDSARVCVSSVLAAMRAAPDSLYFCSGYDDMTSLLRDYYISVGKPDSARRFADLYLRFTSRSPRETNTYTAVAGAFRHAGAQMDLADDSPDRSWLLWVALAVAVIAAPAAILLRRRWRRRGDPQGADETRAHALSVLAALRDGTADPAEWDRFSLLFSSAYPSFIPTLSARFPALTNGDIRLACLTMAGMETKQIARMMNINPSSVTKNRHRLRARLALSPECDLTAFLRALTS